jgi:hypothetical protein
MKQLENFINIPKIASDTSEIEQLKDENVSSSLPAESGNSPIKPQPQGPEDEILKKGRDMMKLKDDEKDKLEPDTDDDCYMLEDLEKIKCKGKTLSKTAHDIEDDEKSRVGWERVMKSYTAEDSKVSYIKFK